jgi:ribosomal protein S27AE
MDVMTLELPPYTGDHPTCPKCGHHGARTRHTPGIEGAVPKERAVCESRFPSGLVERLCRECSRCGYHWDEALATNDDAARFRDRLPLGQQFRTDFVYTHTGETHLVLTHTPSGLKWSMAYPRPGLAEAAEEPLRMFQALLDQVDDWQRQPIETAPSNLETT